jgi:hypothetical protein
MLKEQLPSMKEPFTINLYNNTYLIKPYCEYDCTMYEVFTNCEKLFTLKLEADGSWGTHEGNVFPINKDLIGEIGDAITKYYTSLNPGTQFT